MSAVTTRRQSAGNSKPAEASWAVKSEDVKGAISLLQEPLKRHDGVTALLECSRDTNAFANALWKLSDEKTRNLSIKIRFIKVALNGAVKDSPEGKQLLANIASAEKHLEPLVKAQHIVDIISKVCGNANCPNKNELRDHIWVSIVSGKPINFTVLWDPEWDFSGETTQSEKPMASLLKMLHEINHKFTVSFLSVPSIRTDPAAYSRLETFIEQRHNPSFSIATSMPVSSSPAPAKKQQGEIFISSEISPRPQVPPNAPLIIIPRKRTSESKIKKRIATSIRAIQEPLTRQEGMNFLLTNELLYEDIFPKLWEQVTPFVAHRQALVRLISHVANHAPAKSQTSQVAETLKCRLIHAGGEITRANVSRLLEAMTKREFRAAPPLYTEELYKRIHFAVATGRPLTFTIAWGGFKESRQGLADDYDLRALERIDTWARSLKHPVHLKLIFSDLHATVLNGKPTSASTRYCGGLRKMISGNALQIKLKRLSTLSKKWNSDPKLKERLLRANQEANALAKGAKSGEFNALMKMARKHSDLVRTGRKKAEKVVAEYVAMRHVDDVMLDALYPSSISISISGNPHREAVFATRPALFFTSQTHGLTGPPWQLDEKLDNK